MADSLWQNVLWGPHSSESLPSSHWSWVLHKNLEASWNSEVSGGPCDVGQIKHLHVHVPVTACLFLPAVGHHRTELPHRQFVQWGDPDCVGPICLPFRYPQGKWVSLGHRDWVSCCLPIAFSKLLADLGHLGGLAVLPYFIWTAVQTYYCPAPVLPMLWSTLPSIGLLTMVCRRRNSGSFAICVVRLFLKSISRNKQWLLSYIIKA